MNILKRVKKHYGKKKKEYGDDEMAVKKFKEIIFSWINSAGEKQFERRIVREDSEDSDSEY